MEIINESNTNSTSYDKISINTLFEFIRLNLSQMKNINMVEPYVEVKKIIKTPIKTQTFYEKLSLLTSDDNFISFEPAFLNTFSFYKVKLNLSTLNVISKNNLELSDSSKPPLSNSFFKSILFCLNLLSDDMVKKLIEFMIIDIQNEGFKEHSYSKLKLNKNTIAKNILENNISNDVIRFAGDYLHINIFYFDESGKKFCYEGNEYIPFKKNIILYKYNSEFYPVFTQNTRFFNFKDEPIKSFLINSNEITANNFSVGVADLSKYIKNVKNFNQLILQKTKPEIESIEPIEPIESKSELTESKSELTESKSKPTESVINEFDESYSDDESNTDDSKYLSMSLKDIQKIAQSKKIDIKMNGKLKNKKDLIQEIIQK